MIDEKGVEAALDAATIATAILHEEYVLSPEDAPNLYGKALSTGRLVMALLQPALERARVEGMREGAEAVRIAEQLGSMADTPPSGQKLMLQIRDEAADLPKEAGGKVVLGIKTERGVTARTTRHPQPEGWDL